jgi:2-amino-4-hydroxy-6-hydroxymethyldihydropteridine diphosphokinase
MPVANALIGLGSNLGDRLATLEAAIEQLRQSVDIELYRQSPWLETEPVGGPPDQTPFLNGAAWLKTQLSPLALLARLHEIEQSFGRERRETWGPRTLDLDLLLYDDLVLNRPELQIPHRWLPFRGFVLDPAVVIAPDWDAVLRLLALNNEFNWKRQGLCPCYAAARSDWSLNNRQRAHVALNCRQSASVRD